MSATYQSLLILTTGIIVMLLVAISLDRWWRERSYDLAGKTILITGATRGLGLAMARHLTEAGARLAICARDKQELEQAQTELEQQGAEILAVPCDVTDRAQVEQLIQQAREHLGTIDILINNAGFDLVGPMDLMTLEDYDDAMKLHFWAPLYTTYAVLPEMRERHQGRIVNISSVGGKVAFPHMLPYCASKFALTGLSEGMHAELAKSGVKVTTVCPGLIRTGAAEQVIFKGQNRKEYAWFSISDSLPLLSMSADQVARQTIAALKRGDAEVILSLPAQLGAKFQGLFPGLDAKLLSLVNRLLPAPGGTGTERAFGRDSHPAWFPAWFTNWISSVARPKPSIPAEADGSQANGNSSNLQEQPDRQAQSLTVAADSSGFPIVQPAEAPPEIQACFHAIQDTLGIPWIPANWRAYAIYPDVMQLFWQRLKPATQTESFLEAAIGITEHVYRDITDWYQPNYQIQIDEAEQRHIQRELDAFSFGNPQLLIQQVALSKLLAGEIVGEAGHADARRAPNTHRHHEIQLIDEQSVQKISAEMQQVYRDIRQTLGVPFVNSDYQALARWTAFFLAAWEDIKLWRQRPEYQLLKQEVMQRAEQAASRLHPEMVIGEREVRDLTDNPNDFEQIQQTVQMFTNILPELLIQDALFHVGLANLHPVTTR